MKKKYCYGIILVAVVVLTISRFELFKVVTNSMSEAIKEDDYVLVQKKLTPKSFKAGEIISFYSDLKKSKPVFVKRVAATGQDTIFASGLTLKINGETYPHDVILDQYFWDQDDQTYFFESYFNFLLENTDASVFSQKEKYVNNNYLIVPEHYCFVIGDNYYQSMDSRFWGFIHEDRIIGSVVAVF